MKARRLDTDRAAQGQTLPEVCTDGQPYAVAVHSLSSYKCRE